MKLRQFIELGVGLGLGGGLLYWVLRDYPWKSLTEVSWEWKWLMGAAIIMGLAHLLRAWRWKLFLRASSPIAVSTLDAFTTLMVGYLVNLGLPRVGEIVRCTLLYRSKQVPLAVSLGTVIGERVIDVLLLMVWGGTVIAIEGAEWLRRLGLWQWTPLFLVGIGAGMGLLWGIYHYRERIPWMWARRFTDGITSVFTVKPLLLNLLLSVSIWLCYWIATGMAGLAVENSFSLWMAWVLLVGSGLAMALPAPGGLGTFHAIGFVLLSYLGYADIKAKTIVLIVHAFQTLHTIILGLFALAYFFIYRFPNRMPVKESERSP